MTSEAAAVAAPPADKQTITYRDKRYTTVKEGLAHILVPEPSADDKKRSADGQGVQQVFYNPIQQFNRDLTVLAIKAFGRERVECKKASGRARNERYAEKKRKRKEENGKTDVDRPTKSPKLAEDGAAVAPTNGETAAPADVEIQNETDKDPAAPKDQDQETEPAAADGSGAAADAKAADEVAEKPKTPFTILDALSASGLRALRYAHELPFVTSVTSNDLLLSAVEAIGLNVRHNKLEDKIKVVHDDALAHMYDVVTKDLRGRGKERTEKYDVIDLDPYGSAAPFLDAGVQAVRDDGGLLCVTCTDSGVWASNGYPEKCFSLYGGVPVKAFYSHEVGLRLILHAIEMAAAKYGLAMEPLLSLSIDFYVRVFVRIKKSPATVKYQGAKNMMVYTCDQGCGAFTTQPLMMNKRAPNKNGNGFFYKHGFAKATSSKTCDHCGYVLHVAGPMYAGRIHSPDFIQSILDDLPNASPEVYGTKERIKGMITTALEEVLSSPEELKAAEAHEEAMKTADRAEKKKLEAAARDAELAALDPYPFFFVPAKLSGTIHCAAPGERAMRGALVGLGYRVTRSHCKPGSIKTDAPWSIIWHVMREWVRQKAPVTEANIKEGSVGYRILRLGEKKEADVANPDESRPEKDEQEKMPEVVFDEELGRDADKRKLVRYQMNPRENWGPLNRALGH
ncbi:S-adenosyl-L-methionine-dependent methyltransferase [Podospora didyma]|uniref:tRNA (guanine(26)-N(2))-dimethyltransferase n=1 Tax=Podospora didyma TaxID=330526 RepID=A0AAE0NYT7_9PEZI|nr:S-adenosyl-L-methionine-dependent methyltransferase [Podospora didyma]